MSWKNEPQTPSPRLTPGKIRVLFVCYGNICRSPMAEFVMKDLVEKRGLGAQFYIESAATSDEECWNGVGNPVYPPAREELAKHGISCKGKRARQMTAADYGKFDLIIGMEEMNIRGILSIVGSDPEKKVHRLMSFAGKEEDIRDPWYTGDFAGVYKQIEEGCRALADQMFYEK